MASPENSQERPERRTDVAGTSETDRSVIVSFEDMSRKPNMRAGHEKAKRRVSCSAFHRAIEAAEAGGNAPLGFGLSPEETSAVNRYVAGGRRSVQHCRSLDGLRSQTPFALGPPRGPRGMAAKGIWTRSGELVDSSVQR